MPCMYVLECSNGLFCVGSTWNLDHRLWQHNTGAGAEYAKRRRPVRLVYSEEGDSIADAY